MPREMSVVVSRAYIHCARLFSKVSRLLVSGLECRLLCEGQHTAQYIYFHAQFTAVLPIALSITLINGQTQFKGNLTISSPDKTSTEVLLTEEEVRQPGLKLAVFVQPKSFLPKLQKLYLQVKRYRGPSHPNYVKVCAGGVSARTKNDSLGRWNQQLVVERGHGKYLFCQLWASSMSANEQLVGWGRLQFDDLQSQQSLNVELRVRSEDNQQAGQLWIQIFRVDEGRVLRLYLANGLLLGNLQASEVVFRIGLINHASDRFAIVQPALQKSQKIVLQRELTFVIQNQCQLSIQVLKREQLLFLGSCTYPTSQLLSAKAGHPINLTLCRQDLTICHLTAYIGKSINQFRSKMLSKLVKPDTLLPEKRMNKLQQIKEQQVDEQLSKEGEQSVKGFSMQLLKPIVITKANQRTVIHRKNINTLSNNQFFKLSQVVQQKKGKQLARDQLKSSVSKMTILNIPNLTKVQQNVNSQQIPIAKNRSSFLERQVSGRNQQSEQQLPLVKKKAQSKVKQVEQQKTRVSQHQFDTPLTNKHFSRKQQQVSTPTNIHYSRKQQAKDPNQQVDTPLTNIHSSRRNSLTQKVDILHRPTNQVQFKRKCQSSSKLKKMNQGRPVYSKANKDQQKVDLLRRLKFQMQATIEVKPQKQITPRANIFFQKQRQKIKLLQGKELVKQSIEFYDGEEQKRTKVIDLSLRYKPLEIGGMADPLVRGLMHIHERRPRNPIAELGHFLIQSQPGR